jgi:excisionase family DNA binding protein
MNAEQTTTDTVQRWVDYEEAGRLYGLSRWTLWRLTCDGRIRAARIGRATRLDLASIERYMAEQAENFG